jgi:hypothetical protein
MGLAGLVSHVPYSFSFSLLTSPPRVPTLPTLADLQKHAQGLGDAPPAVPGLPSYRADPKPHPSSTQSTSIHNKTNNVHTSSSGLASRNPFNAWYDPSPPPVYTESVIHSSGPGVGDSRNVLVKKRPGYLKLWPQGGVDDAREGGLVGVKPKMQSRGYAGAVKIGKYCRLLCWVWLTSQVRYSRLSRVSRLGMERGKPRGGLGEYLGRMTLISRLWPCGA